LKKHLPHTTLEQNYKLALLLNSPGMWAVRSLSGYQQQAALLLLEDKVPTKSWLVP
jgi:hypothetical protein